MLSFKRPVLTVLALCALLLLWGGIVTSAMWAFGHHLDQPTAFDLLIMYLLIVLPGFVGVPISIAMRRKRIAPILAEAPITQETITYRDIRAMATREQAKRSMRYLIGTSLLYALVAALQIVQLIIREPQHPCVLV